MVRTRLNEVLYSDRPPSLSKNVVHKDRLTKFNGDSPPEWRNAVKKLRTEAAKEQPVVAWTCPDERRESVNAAETIRMPSIQPSVTNQPRRRLQVAMRRAALRTIGTLGLVIPLPCTSDRPTAIQPVMRA